MKMVKECSTEYVDNTRIKAILIERDGAGYESTINASFSMCKLMSVIEEVQLSS